MNAKPAEKRTVTIVKIKTLVPGAREHALMLVAAILVFIALIGASGYVMIGAMKVGPYAVAQISRGLPAVLVYWLLATLALTAVAVRISLAMAERIAGPVRRMEKLLDRMLYDRETTIVLRENDAIVGIAERINRLIEREKAGKAGEHA